MFGLPAGDTAAAAALTVMATALAAWLAPLPAAAATALLAAPLWLILFTDLRFRRIPDLLSLPLIPLGLGAVLVLWPERFVWHATGGAVGFLTFWAVRWAYRQWRGIEGLGLGDVKLMAAAGAWCGLDTLAPITLLACLAALASLLLVRGRGGGQPSRHTRIALGVYLGPAILLAWLHHLAAAQ